MREIFCEKMREKENEVGVGGCARATLSLSLSF